MSDTYDKEQDLHWYAPEDGTEAAREASMCASAWRMAMELRSQQRDKLMANAADRLALYDPGTLSDEESGLKASASVPFYEPEVPAFNVVQAGTDTLVSQLIRNKVRPLFLTDGGDAELQDKAEGMTRIVESLLMEAGIYGELGRQWARDGGVHGTGWIKITPDYGSTRAVIERAFDWEIYAATNDSKRGSPRQMHHVYAVDRAALAERYPDHRDAIERAETADYRQTGAAVDRGNVVDMILVAESWHLPSTRVDLDDEESWDLHRAKHDGAHTITIGMDDDCLLLAEAWPFDYFPLIPFKLIGKNMGLRGRGVPETLLGVQIALNRTCKRLDRILDLHGRPIMLLDRRAKINKNLLSNEIGLVLESTGGGGLQVVTPHSVSPEFVQQIDRLVRWGFEQIGLSQLSATSKKPEGLESGVALRTVLDTESMRHSDPFLGWEEAHIKAARVLVDVVRLLAEHSENFTVFWGDEREMRALKVKDFDLPEDKFRLRSWPTNLFSQTPGAKKDEVLTFYREGFYDKEEAMMHLDYPDTRAARDAILAARKNIEKILLRVKKGEPHTPHPYMNLPLAKKLGIIALNELEARDLVDSDAAERVRRWLEMVDLELDKIAQKAAAMQAAMAPPPMGAPPGGPGPAGAAPAGAPPAPPMGVAA